MTTPASLDSPSLARRLGELAGDERCVQVEFLLHLDEYDKRRAWLELGYGSLWTYCLEAQHLREGSAGRRIAAMKVLRSFPHLAEALRDGRLCLSTLAQLGPVLIEENVREVVARAAWRTAAEVGHLVASIRSRQAPREGIRLLPASAAASEPASPRGVPDLPAAPSSGPGGTRRPEAHPAEEASTSVPAVPADRPRHDLRAVSESHWSLRVTVDRAMKEDLETLSQLLSHKFPKGDLAAVLHEAVRCALEKHGKRKGAVKPARQVKAKAPNDPAKVSAALRRKVWERDGGRCAWMGPDGRRCNSRWQVEVDHIDPVGRGGIATLDRLRLLCKGHNGLYAEQVYGMDHIRKSRMGESTTDVGSARERAPAGAASVVD
jgi:hypothetical protein